MDYRQIYFEWKNFIEKERTTIIIESIENILEEESFYSDFILNESFLNKIKTKLGPVVALSLLTFYMGNTLTHHYNSGQDHNSNKTSSVKIDDSDENWMKDAPKGKFRGMGKDGKTRIEFDIPSEKTIASAKITPKVTALANKMVIKGIPNKVEIKLNNESPETIKKAIEDLQDQLSTEEISDSTALVKELQNKTSFKKDGNEEFKQIKVTSQEHKTKSRSPLSPNLKKLTKLRTNLRSKTPQKIALGEKKGKLFYSDNADGDMQDIKTVSEAMGILAYCSMKSESECKDLLKALDSGGQTKTKTIDVNQEDAGSKQDFSKEEIKYFQRLSDLAFDHIAKLGGSNSNSRTPTSIKTIFNNALNMLIQKDGSINKSEFNNLFGNYNRQGIVTNAADSANIDGAVSDEIRQ